MRQRRLLRPAHRGAARFVARACSCDDLERLARQVRALHWHCVNPTAEYQTLHQYACE
jgi:hypothetical protein